MSWATRKCKRPDVHEDDRLCFCPADGRIRVVLRQKFINGWVPEAWTAKANEMADNGNAQEEDLWALLFKIEEAANSCYGMWRNTL